MAERRRRRIKKPSSEAVEAPQETDKATAVGVPMAVDEDGEEDRATVIIAKYKERVKNPLTAIRAACVECMGGGVQEIASCASTGCPLHPFRMGKNTMHGTYGKSRPDRKKGK